MDQVLAFLTNESMVIIFATVVGIIYKFVPSFKNLSNEIIPLLAALTAFLTHVLTPEVAHAGILGDVARGAFGIGAPLVLSVIDARIAKFVHEHILRGAAIALNVKKP